MRTLAALAAALLAAGASAGPVPQSTARPRHVMSLNVCTDQLVLALLPPDRVASVTWLARDPASSLMVPAARRVAVNHAGAEEVLAERPDLVIAGTFTTTATRAMLHRLGWPMLEVGPADTLADIRATTRAIARAVGEPARGEALLTHMARQVATLARDPGPPLRVAAWDGSGFGAGRGSLFDTVLTLAGAVNVAAGARSGVPDTELLLRTAPTLLVRGGGDARGTLRTNVALHPLVRRFWGRERTLVVPPAAYLCGTPFIADAALDLQRQLRAAAARVPPPLPFAAPIGRSAS